VDDDDRCPPGGPRPLAPGEAKRTLAARMGRVADRLRQKNTRFGLRPYRVLLRWTMWGDAERGDGHERDVAVVELLPTPLVTSMDSVSFSLFHAGTVPVGSLKVAEVSAYRYTEDNLRGLVIPIFDDGSCAYGVDDCDPCRVTEVLRGLSVADGESVLQPYQFYYEVVMDDRLGDDQVRKRFRLMNEPMLRADKMQWNFLLEATSPNRSRSDVSPFGRK
jgi:hypothetical protein